MARKEIRLYRYSKRTDMALCILHGFKDGWDCTKENLSEKLRALPCVKHFRWGYDSFKYQRGDITFHDGLYPDFLIGVENKISEEGSHV